MNTPNMLSSLNLFTLIGVLVIVAVAFAWWMRKKSNRNPLPDDEGFENNRETDLRH